jgi:hypothetical protein
MFKGFTLFIFVASCVVCLICGGAIVNSCESGKQTKVQHDTLTIVKISPAIHDTFTQKQFQIKYVLKPIIQYVYDTSTKKISAITGEDTATCYTLTKDTLGNHAEMTMCSDSFPKKKPLDLSGMLYFQAAPCSSKTITMRITVEKQAPLFKSPWFWFWDGVFLIGGVYAGHSIK